MDVRTAVVTVLLLVPVRALLGGGSGDPAPEASLVERVERIWAPVLLRTRQAARLEEARARCLHYLDAWLERRSRYANSAEDVEVLRSRRSAVEAADSFVSLDQAMRTGPARHYLAREQVSELVFGYRIRIR